ncbi:DegT/DnrJ/EryC1/StrS family aminotransferase [Niabella insulamsoli]|uniref:DegT/DnrJ/EryC1/StrS family aminotransferase n=1 Tax=Niabella insulamsoli TaxID=3144874 RepID=UPI0031FC96E9
MISLYKPYMPDTLPELNAILHSGALAYGKWGRQFEADLGRYLETDKIITVNSYNAAMQVALTVIGIGPGDEVIVSPMSCLASNQPLVTQGATVVWADIDPATGTLNPESVKSKITSKTKAILHNHHCGYAGYIDEVNEIGRSMGVKVIDDAIEAFGTEYKGQKIGSLSTDITVFSFQTVRLPNTIDGGALKFNDEVLLNRAILTRDLGVDRSRFRDSKGEISKTCDIELPGFGVTMSEINSYIGFEQLKDLPKLIDRQQINGTRWAEKILKEVDGCSLVGTAINQRPNYWVFGLLSDRKNTLMSELRAMGYYASGVHLPNNFYSVFGDRSELPGVKDFYSKFLALPSGWWTNITGDD